MSKKCKIYYGTVGEGDVYSGSHEEPIKDEGRDPLGKSPEFCCEELRKAKNNFLFYFDSGRKQLMLRAAEFTQVATIRFCPYCGAKIILIEDLKLRAVETTYTVKSYYFEKA